MRLPILLLAVFFVAGSCTQASAQYAAHASINYGTHPFILLMGPAATPSVTQDTVPGRPPDTSLVSADSIQDSIHRYVIKHDSKPWDYIMKRKGQLIEVTQGRQQPVNHDVVLLNLTTIHPDGTINDSNGKTKHLEEGKYITMDGRIRNLDRLPEGLPNH